MQHAIGYHPAGYGFPKVTSATVYKGEDEYDDDTLVLVVEWTSLASCD